VRAIWSVLHRDLCKSLRSSETQLQFRHWRSQSPLFEPFEEPAVLVALLQRDDVDLVVKEPLIRHLVAEAQRSSSAAQTVLWLANWPWLDRLHATQRRYWPVAELTSSLTTAFLARVRRLRLDRVRTVTVSLAMCTRRDLILLSRRRRAELKSNAARARDGRWVRANQEDLFVTAEVLAVLSPDDAELVVAACVGEEDLRAAGERLGLSHDVARKRYARALEKIRRESTDDVSHLTKPKCI
jgi:RNA polymerase sigma-70 factor (ECF subfamily)